MVEVEVAEFGGDDGGGIVSVVVVGFGFLGITAGVEGDCLLFETILS